VIVAPDGLDVQALNDDELDICGVILTVANHNDALLSVDNGWRDIKNFLPPDNDRSLRPAAERVRTVLETAVSELDTLLCALKDPAAAIGALCAAEAARYARQWTQETGERLDDEGLSVWVAAHATTLTSDITPLIRSYFTHVADAPATLAKGDRDA
jgi:hypothetical protein